MRDNQFVDPNPAYWTGHTNLQRVKHDIIAAYLGGWFPILGSWAGRILYVDTHAGRGRHAQGELGSPLVALTTLLHHATRDRILSRCEVRFVFLERDPDNANALESELAEFMPLPAGIAVDRYADDYHSVLSEVLATLQGSGVPMAPSFIFVDPYGFKLPYPLLAQFMAFDAVELLVNVMWRHLDMALAQAQTVDGRARLLDFMFGCTDWRDIAALKDYDRRCSEVLSLIGRIIGAKWATSVHMLGSNDVTEYVLLHLTNHDAGSNLMKRVLWRVCPSFSGRFVARKADDPSQGVLLSVEPDLSALRTRIVDGLGQHPLRWRTLHAMVRGDIWLEAHVNRVVRQLLKEKRVVPSDYVGRCTPKSDPILTLR